MSDSALTFATQLFELWAAGTWGAEVPLPAEAAALVAAAKRAVKRGRDEEVAKRMQLEQAVDIAADSLARIVIQGDLTQESLGTTGTTAATQTAGLGALNDAVNQSALLLREFVRSMKLAAAELGSGTQVTYGLLEHNTFVLNDQAKTAQHLASTLAELKSTSVAIELSATTVAALSKESEKASVSGSNAVQDFSVLMSELEDNAVSVAEAVGALSTSVLQIDAVIKLITEVADRSDMLALNAALEAARAGVAGRGFAIVAEEMRRLSARVVANTTEVAGLVSAVRQATEKVRDRAAANIEVAASGHSRAVAALKNLGGILAAVHQTADAAEQISLATQHQRASTAEAAHAVTELSDEAREVATGTENTRVSAEKLASLSTQLELLVKRFSTGD